jgi:hypothetical protein
MKARARPAALLIIVVITLGCIQPSCASHGWLRKLQEVCVHNLLLLQRRLHQLRRIGPSLSCCVCSCCRGSKYDQ